MADHTITLTAKQENAAQLIVNGINNAAFGTPGTLTIEAWIKDVILGPIRNKIADLKAQNVVAVADAYDAANNAVQAQVRAVLGL